MNSLDTRFARNVFETDQKLAIQKTRSTCFIRSKNHSAAPRGFKSQ